MASIVTNTCFWKVYKKDTGKYMVQEKIAKKFV